MALVHPIRAVGPSVGSLNALRPGARVRQRSTDETGKGHVEGSLATMETVRLPAAWAHGAYERVYVAQFAHVRNGAALKDALIAASKSPENSDERRRMDYAFVDARLLVSRAQLLTAVVEAIVASERVRNDAPVGLKTPSIHSEILWTLNPNNNVCCAAH